jgi:hypothetical protein
MIMVNSKEMGLNKLYFNRLARKGRHDKLSLNLGTSSKKEEPYILVYRFILQQVT